MQSVTLHPNGLFFKIVHCFFSYIRSMSMFNVIGFPIINLFHS
jgi:hypothetical protein